MPLRRRGSKAMPLFATAAASAVRPSARSVFRWSSQSPEHHASLHREDVRDFGWADVLVPPRANVAEAFFVTDASGRSCADAADIVPPIRDRRSDSVEALGRATALAAKAAITRRPIVGGVAGRRGRAGDGRHRRDGGTGRRTLEAVLTTRFVPFAWRLASWAAHPAGCSGDAPVMPGFFDWPRRAAKSLKNGAAGED